MSEGNPIRQAILRAPRGAAVAYAAVVAACIAIAWSAAADLVERHADVAAAREILAQLEGRRPSLRGAAGAVDAGPAGSPFLEGSTVTVAGAALLQRVSAAVTKVGGSVVSSQVELQTAQSKMGFIGVVASCEIVQPALQQLLYDLEAGMPFLFVNQLVVQAPVATSASPEARMHVLIAVSGQWQGGK